MYVISLFNSFTWLITGLLVPTTKKARFIKKTECGMAVISSVLAVLLMARFSTAGVTAPTSSRYFVDPLDVQETEIRGQDVHVEIQRESNLLIHPTASSYLSATEEVVTDCPAICNCTLSTNFPFTVNCSWRNLSEIPTHIPNTALVLNLRGNHLTTIPSFAFISHRRLVELDLSQNNISKLHNFSFSGLIGLKTLFLSGNILAYKQSMDVNAFRQVPRLTNLQIQNNCPKVSQNCVDFGLVLSGAPQLENLTMDALSNRTLGIEFRSLTLLRRLSFNGEGAVCKISRLTTETLMNLNENLKELDVSNCKLEYVDRNALQNLSAIKIVRFENNEDLCFEGLHNISLALQGTNIEELYLRGTCNTELSLKDSSIFAPLSLSNLRVLDIQQCRISHISIESLAALPITLQYFSLSQNNIFFIHQTIVWFLCLFALPNLEWIDGSLQDQYTVRNRTGQVDENATIPWPEPIPLPPKLKFVNASNIKLTEYSIPNVSFKDNMVEVIDISHDYFQNITGLIKGLRSLTHLYMHHNLIQNIYPMAFSDMPNLKLLDLSHNQIGASISPSEQSFSKLYLLTTLCLSYNEIKDLHVSCFEDLISLKYLYLDHNALTVVNFDVSSMTNLSLLTLDHNQIFYIESTFLSSLVKVGGYHVITLTLAGNKFQCVCSSTARTFVRWLSQTNVNIEDRSLTYCTLTDGSTKVMTASNTTSIASHLAIVCIWWQVLAGCVLLFIVLTIVLSLCAFIYRQRWKIRYLYYTGRNRINPFYPIEETPDTYHVYISFDESHSELYRILTTDIYQNLESIEMRVCIREHLQPGGMLRDVSLFIHNSKKVLVFISEDYCKDFWNVFEFNMAAYEGIYTRRNVIIPVIVGNFRDQDLHKEIRAFLVNKPVIKVDTAVEILQRFDDIVRRIQSD